MVFFFGRRLQTTAYLRDSLIEGARQQELKILLRELHDRAMEGPLNPQHPPPDHYGPTRRLWESREFMESSWESSHESEEEKTKRLDREKEIKYWEMDERMRYEELRVKAEALALAKAKKKIPNSIDISLLGGGWAFLLEFSTVIVIIFALLILGISSKLEGKDIATILAAIAGYVLGKATGSKQSEKSITEDASKTEK